MWLISCLSNSSFLPLPHRSETLCSKLRAHQLSTSVSSPVKLKDSTSVSSPLKVGDRDPNPLIIELLTKEYGVSRRKAISVSKTLRRSITPSDLTSVPKFLKENGFSDIQIITFISSEPRLLCAKIDKTLKPKLKFLEEELGLSDSSLAEFAAHHSCLFRLSVKNHIIPIIDVLGTILDSNDEIVKVLDQNIWLLGSRSAIYNIRTNIDLLRKSGVPESQIKYLLRFRSRSLNRKPDAFQDLLSLVDNLGVKRDSKSFVYAVGAVASMTKSTLDRKFKLYMSYGWSESDIMTAVAKFPQFLTGSEEKFRKLMSLLVDELEQDHKDIVLLLPTLFCFSLEKRLKPRYDVLKILSAKGLLKKKKMNIYTIANMSYAKFLEKYIVKFVDRAPEIRKAYMTSADVLDN